MFLPPRICACDPARSQDQRMGGVITMKVNEIARSPAIIDKSIITGFSISMEPLCESPNAIQYAFDMHVRPYVRTFIRTHTSPDWIRMGIDQRKPNLMGIISHTAGDGVDLLVDEHVQATWKSEETVKISHIVYFSLATM